MVKLKETLKKPAVKYLSAFLCLAAAFVCGLLIGNSPADSAAPQRVEVRVFDGQVEAKSGSLWSPYGSLAELLSLDPAYIARNEGSPAAADFGARDSIGAGTVRPKSSGSYGGSSGGSSGGSGSNPAPSNPDTGSGDGEDIWSGDIL